MKKEWKKPLLMVLTRLKAEENVLSSCKNTDLVGDNNSHNGACDEYCLPCHDFSGS